MTGVTNLMAEMIEAEDQASAHGGADITRRFYYLAGPMSNLPKFNFPRFNELAEILRNAGCNICNPAEFEHEIARFILASEEGSGRRLNEQLLAAGLQSSTWAECLKRDIRYVADDNCEGVIVMEGWEHSQGAQFETYVAYKLRKPIFALKITEDGRPILTEIDRRAALDAVGVID